jgi:hypothetical protein
MARVDDYANAKKIALERLAAKSASDIAECSGFALTGGSVFQIPFLDRLYRAEYPEFAFVDVSNADKPIPLQEQVLILHYMDAGKPLAPAGKWIAYREIQGASFYYSAFVKRAIDPLKKVFGKNTAGMAQAAEKLGGVSEHTGDAGFVFRVLPKVPLALILWEADAEFEAEANVLFDSTAGEFLSPEDAVWLAGMLVYRLIALSRA